MAKDKWIGDAVKHPGSLTRAAKKHGRTTLGEAKVESKSPKSKIASRGRLALRFIGKAKNGNIKKATRKRVSKKA